MFLVEFIKNLAYCLLYNSYSYELRNLKKMLPFGRLCRINSNCIIVPLGVSVLTQMQSCGFRFQVWHCCTSYTQEAVLLASIKRLIHAH
ncbi:hypothetical protein COCON_G00198200 [Conger conger]|uniref:Uncharacterized protein n=1 Tax=Conger conger TaxID=82655 RepID=A0A9Q1D1I1_CONCO|nr:hypothetical protein COCON_G00198200 [Conger conger]